jgi:hypothetical protein
MPACKVALAGALGLAGASLAGAFGADLARGAGLEAGALDIYENDCPPPGQPKMRLVLDGGYLKHTE